ncbi:MAG TPA: ribosome-binding factor A [Polyangiaceae bacterium]|nr:ribosome-binding factor A [Polyangiaceae bacterium]
MRREDEHAGFRHIRLQDLILEELRGLLRDDISDPTLQGVWITALVLSVDYRHARVHFASKAARGEEIPSRRADVEQALARATPFLRARLADAIDIKRVPDLRFVFDAAAIAPDAAPSTPDEDS